jgi:hypothetical protein
MRQQRLKGRLRPLAAIATSLVGRPRLRLRRRPEPFV